MAETLAERKARLADKLKNEPSMAPIQEVNPVSEVDKPATKWAINKDDELVQLNVKVPRNMSKAIKQIALDDEVDIREVVWEAISQYLKKRKSS
ncbi:hypothetical protein J2I47_22010 [Fibrella sp. HMF5335]|uniref:Uncharacterized protein n=1 Tax=Fibrella rubiginis TaxID=2817060 RepID=A0A939GHP2_9BACT|nr:hypothetical protein [Fibrella rubiginis]MBO0939244.1 hypothetical protein [Fibrella rubiginis]